MELFVVGKVTGCFGIRGDVKIQPATHSPDRLKKLRHVYIGESDRLTREYNVRDVGMKRGSVIVHLAGVDDRTSAERLVGCFLFVEGSDLVPPGKGSFFIHDLLGSTVVTVDGRELGTLEDIFKLPAQDLWIVRHKGQELMIPAVKEFIREVDIARKRVVVSVIEGLIDG